MPFLASRLLSQRSAALRAHPLGRSFFLGANWKCSLESVAEVDSLVDNLNDRFAALDDAAPGEVVISPPHVFLDRVRPRVKKTRAPKGEGGYPQR